MERVRLFLGFVHFVDLDVELLSDVSSVSVGVKDETALLFARGGSFAGFNH